jgi:hypothetical protein
MGAGNLKRLFLLLALVGWLFPYHSRADEKPLLPIKDVIIENNGDVSGFSRDDISQADIDRLYNEWLARKNKPALNKPVKVTRFAPGYCTDYVARKVQVTWYGNANQWIANAKAQGYTVNKDPVAGSILVTRESRLGHVSYIEKVEGDKVYISEWNYAGRYKLTYRTLDINNPIIQGVIHP